MALNLTSCSGCVAGDGKELLTVGADKVIALTISIGAVVEKSSRLRDPVQSLEVSPDGRLAAAWLLDVKTPRRVHSAKHYAALEETRVRRFPTAETVVFTLIF
jgi:hypothetical protein